MVIFLSPHSDCDAFSNGLRIFVTVSSSSHSCLARLYRLRFLSLEHMLISAFISASARHAMAYVEFHLVGESVMSARYRIFSLSHMPFSSLRRLGDFRIALMRRRNFATVDVGADDLALLMRCCDALVLDPVRVMGGSVLPSARTSSTSASSSSVSLSQ